MNENKCVSPEEKLGERFEEFYEKQNNQPMRPCQRDFSRELIEAIWEGSL